MALCVIPQNAHLAMRAPDSHLKLRSTCTAVQHSYTIPNRCHRAPAHKAPAQVHGADVDAHQPLMTPGVHPIPVGAGSLPNAIGSASAHPSAKWQHFGHGPTLSTGATGFGIPDGSFATPGSIFGTPLAGTPLGSSQVCQGPLQGLSVDRERQRERETE